MESHKLTYKLTSFIVCKVTNLFTYFIYKIQSQKLTYILNSFFTNLRARFLFHTPSHILTHPLLSKNQVTWRHLLTAVRALGSARQRSNMLMTRTWPC